MTIKPGDIYGGCTKVLEIYPGTLICDARVRLTPEHRKGSQVRCELHPSLPMWPTEESHEANP